MISTSNKAQASEMNSPPSVAAAWSPGSDGMPLFLIDIDPHAYYDPPAPTILYTILYIPTPRLKFIKMGRMSSGKIIHASRCEHLIALYDGETPIGMPTWDRCWLSQDHHFMDNALVVVTRIMQKYSVAWKVDPW
jgi:hypothetical protein